MAKKRGRKTVGSLGAVESIPTRPEPPEYFGGRQSEIWSEVTAGMAVEWFGSETHQLLRSYCNHMSRFESMSLAADTLLAEGALDESVKMAKAAEVESRAALSYATKMRITQQSTYHPEKNKKSEERGAAPWKTLANS